MRFEVLSLAMTLGFLLLATWRAWRQRRRPGVDVVLALIDGTKLGRRPMLVGFAFWTCFAVLSEVVVAWETEGRYLSTRDGVLALVTFAVLVPIDVGAYFWLRTAAARFFSLSMLSELGLTLRRAWVMESRSRALFWLHQASIILAALMIQTFAMQSEICAGPTYSPWVARTATPPSAIELPWFVTCPNARASSTETPVVHAELRQLTVRGAIHYAIRGIGAYLAVNFVVVIFAVFWLLCVQVTAPHPERAFTRWHRPQPLIGDLGLSLLVAVLFGVLATTFEGITLFLILWKPISGTSGNWFQAAQAAWAQNRTLVDVAQRSTWLFWFAMSILVTGLTIATIRRFQSLLERGKEVIVTSALEELEYYGRGRSLAECETYWTTRAAIVAAADKIETTPVRALKGLLGSAIILQILALLPKALTLLSR